MRVVAIIQARMGSSRLPGKVLADIHGKPMLQRVVERVRLAVTVDDVWVATTDDARDDALVALCDALDAPVFRGSEDDVLQRYVGAANAARAGVVVRITSDCPLIDAVEIDRVVAAFADAGADYASNSLERSFPRGLDAEAVPAHLLRLAAAEATTAWQRAHVTPFFYQQPQRFHLVGVRCERDLSLHRWTVDTPEDLALVQAVHARLADHDDFAWRDVLAIVEAEPAIAALNAHVEQKALHLG